MLKRVFLSLFLAAAVVFAWAPWADDLADRYTNEALFAASSSFAIARTINATVSVILESEATVSAAAVEGTVAVGQLLDPINDMVERFSEVAFTATVALGMQSLLIRVFGNTALNIALSLAALMLFVFLWRPDWRRRVPASVVRLGIFFVALRFAIVGIALLNQGFFELFLEDRYESAKTGLETTIEGEVPTESGAMEAPDIEEEETGVFDAVTGFWDSVSKYAGQLTDIEGLADRLGASIQHITTIILVLVLNYMVLPLVLILLALKGGQKLWNLPLEDEPATA